MGYRIDAQRLSTKGDGVPVGRKDNSTLLVITPEGRGQNSLWMSWGKVHTYCASIVSATRQDRESRVTVEWYPVGPFDNGRTEELEGQRLPITNLMPPDRGRYWYRQTQYISFHDHEDPGTRDQVRELLTSNVTAH